MELAVSPSGREVGISEDLCQCLRSASVGGYEALLRRVRFVGEPWAVVAFLPAYAWRSRATGQLGYGILLYLFGN